MCRINEQKRGSEIHIIKQKWKNEEQFKMKIE